MCGALRRAHFAHRKLPSKVLAHIRRCEVYSRYHAALQWVRQRWELALSTDPRSTPARELAHKLARRIVRFANLCRMHAPAKVIRDEWTMIHLVLLESASEDAVQILHDLPLVLFGIGARETLREVEPEECDEVEERLLKELKAVPL